MQLLHEPDAGRAVAIVGDRLTDELQAGKRLVWFICGGSNIPLIVASMAMIPPELTGKLTILLTDERYGEPGHADSNWRQLDDAGFDAGSARVLRTLRAGHDIDQTCAAYEADVREALNTSDYRIAQFGIGSDGHIAGILPGSPASRLAIDDTTAPLVVCYDAGPYQRITVTPPVWQSLDAAYACAYGSGKAVAIAALAGKPVSVSEQPAQLLRQVPEAYVFTDQLPTD